MWIKRKSNCASQLRLGGSSNYPSIRMFKNFSEVWGLKKESHLTIYMNQKILTVNNEFWKSSMIINTRWGCNTRDFVLRSFVYSLLINWECKVLVMFFRRSPPSLFLCPTIITFVLSPNTQLSLLLWSSATEHGRLQIRGLW